MSKTVHFTIMLFFVALFLLAAQYSYAQDVTSKLYIEVSANVKIVKNGVNDSLLIDDYLGSVRTVSNIENNREAAVYSPYGTDYVNNISLTDKQFTGHRKVDELSVYHANARFYSPRFGQFIQADTMDADGPHRYRYTLNNPVSFNDPSGNGVAYFPFMKDHYSEDEYEGQDGNPILRGLAAINQGLGIGDLLDFAGRGLDRAIGMTPEHPNFYRNPVSLAGRALNSNLNKYLTPGQAASVDMLPEPAMVVSAAPRVGRQFTQMFMRQDQPYQQGLRHYARQWQNNRRIEPFLREHPDPSINLPFADPISDYADFKRRAQTVNGGREMGQVYHGLFARPVGEGVLRVSPQNPGIVKHGMLTSGAPVDLAGEFSYGWRMERGRKVFGIFDVNLSSGGYRPRTYNEKLHEARSLLEGDIYRGLGGN